VKSVTYRVRDLKRPHLDVREIVVSECVLFLRRETHHRIRKARKGLRAHAPAREGVRANEKSIHVGSIDSPWCSHEVGEKGLRNPPRTRLNHDQTLSRNPRSQKSTLEFPSPNLPTRDESRCQRDQHRYSRGS